MATRRSELLQQELVAGEPAAYLEKANSDRSWLQVFSEWLVGAYDPNHAEPLTDEDAAFLDPWR